MSNPKFDRIMKALNAAGMHATARALDSAADDEASDLRAVITAYQKRDNGEAAREAAEEFYAMETIAEVIRTNNIKID